MTKEKGSSSLAPKSTLAPRKTSASKRVSWEDEKINEKLGTLKDVPKENILPDPNQPRRTFGAEELADMQASLETHGLLQPLIVRELGEETGSYQLIAGERRWRAAMNSEIVKTLAVVVRSDLKDELPILLAQIAENLHREDMNILELAESYQRVFDAVDRNAEQAAALLGISKPRFYHVLSVDKAPQAVKELAANGVTSDVNVLAGLKTLAEINPEKAQEVIEQTKSGELNGGGLRKAVADGVRDEKQKKKKEKGPKAAVTDKDDGAQAEQPVIEEVAAGSGVPVAVMDVDTAAVVTPNEPVVVAPVMSVVTDAQNATIDDQPVLASKIWTIQVDEDVLASVTSYFESIKAGVHQEMAERFLKALRAAVTES